MVDLDILDQRLLDRIQAGFPLQARPFEALGRDLGLEEKAVIHRLERLRDQRVLRQIAAIFDSRALGYHSALVAAQAPAGGIEAAAAVVSAHPGVSHNYQREHALDLWFTLAVPPDRSLEKEAAQLARAAGLLRHHALPSLRTFRIGVAFDMATGQARSQGPATPAKPRIVAVLDEADKAAVRALQTDLALVPEPFAPLAAGLGLSQDRLFAWAAEAQDRGLLRRYAGVLRHREAGFGEGGMGVWRVPLEQVEPVGRAFAAEAAVTHCYQRPSFPDWPYNVFTMVHGASREDCAQVLEGLAQRVEGWQERAVLFSTREFKKERVKYFLEEPAGLSAGV